jgi:hypothetical protein
MSLKYEPNPQPPTLKTSNRFVNISLADYNADETSTSV